MQAFHRVLAVVGLLLLFALFVGVVHRRKATQCSAFSAYITAALVFGILILSFPGAYTPQAFLIKQGIYDALLFAMAIELSVRVFAAFKGVADRVRTLLGVAVLVSTASVFLLTPQNVRYADLARYQPGITTAGVWCLAFVALLIVWYQIPVPAFTRAIILGYVPYLVVFVVCVDLIGRLGWAAVQGINVANALAYDAVAGYWVYAAWRKD